MSQTIVTGEILTDGLRRLGVRPGGVLLVHSSLKSLGHVEGGPTAVIAALEEVLTPDGTLVMPTLTYDKVDAERPRFDVRHTPSSTGRVTEMFRAMPDVRRSLHPTHSLAARGRLRDSIIEGHQRCRSAGPINSPWHRLYEHDAQILFLGVTTAANTMLHCVEEWAPAPESLHPETQSLEVVDYDGRVIPSPQHRHAGGRSRFYEKMTPLFEAWGCLTVGTISDATCRLVACRTMVDRTLELLRNVDIDLFTHDRLPEAAE